MNKLITVALLSLGLCSTAAFATTHKEAPDMAASGAAGTMGRQQSKMGSCSAEFKTTGKAGSERQAFMKECLAAEADAKTTQQSKMGTCSTEFKATGKAGSERQTFMKECLAK